MAVQASYSPSVLNDNLAGKTRYCGFKRTKSNIFNLLVGETGTLRNNGAKRAHAAKLESDEGKRYKVGRRSNVFYLSFLPSSFVPRSFAQQESDCALSRVGNRECG